MSDVPSLLQPLKDRVEKAEASRARSRANPDPIFDAAMMLDIQATSMDVPKLIAAIEAVEKLLCGPNDHAVPANQPDLVPPWYSDRIRAALAQALGGDTA